ncbi:MAG: hypothetical protein JWQ83_312 [Lacunisphaera sp.]|nr:hypothetical protein [Lacunisphaera sp.]MDB6165172.1 hypothetical protein [Lacunisphaera sp.]
MLEEIALPFQFLTRKLRTRFGLKPSQHAAERQTRSQLKQPVGVIRHDRSRESIGVSAFGKTGKCLMQQGLQGRVSEANPSFNRTTSHKIYHPGY